MDQRFESRLEQMDQKLELRFDKIDDGFAIMKISFDDVYERLDQHETNINSLKNEIARVGDSTARIEKKLDMELAAIGSRFRRVEQHCGI